MCIFVVVAMLCEFDILEQSVFNLQSSLDLSKVLDGRRIQVVDFEISTTHVKLSGYRHKVGDFISLLTIRVFFSIKKTGSHDIAETFLEITKNTNVLTNKAHDSKLFYVTVIFVNGVVRRNRLYLLTY